MTSSNLNASTMAIDEEAFDPVLASIRKVEAIRDFASDITPLRSDGFNLHSWVGEIDKTLSDLIDRERYLRGPPTEPIVKSEDKIARNLIYWTIPRELRSLINDANTARDAYKALQAQFLRNTRTSHMASLVDLFNFQMDVTEPHHITLLYDQMYKAMNELVASGFVITEDSMLGAMFQIAVGRANSHLYTATSRLLDTKFANDQQSITSHEVCAAARRQLEHWHNTIFDEGPMTTSNEIFESLDPQTEEEGNHVPSVNVSHPSMDSFQHVLPATNGVHQQQPLRSHTLAEQPQPQPVAGSSNTRNGSSAVQSTPSAASFSSTNPAAPPSVPQNHQAKDVKTSIPSSKPSDTNQTDKSSQADVPKTAAPASSTVPAPFSGLNPAGASSKPSNSTSSNNPSTSSILFGSTKSTTPSSTTNAPSFNLFGTSKTNPITASSNSDCKQD